MNQYIDYTLLVIAGITPFVISMQFGRTIFGKAFISIIGIYQTKELIDNKSYFKYIPPIILGTILAYPYIRGPK